VLCLPYAEALMMKPRLAKKLAALKADTRRLPIIDRELGFLQFLKQSQPPYLDALFLLSKSAPQGSRLDSLAMNRRGDLSWRGSMRDSSQVSDFRSKLIDSGFFTNVVVEEQTPTPDRQKVTVRMTAQWKSATARAALAIGPTPAEIEKAKNSKDAPAGNMPPGFPPGMSFPGMPPGMNISVSPPSSRSSRRSSSTGPGAVPGPAGAPNGSPGGPPIVIPADGSPVFPGTQSHP
jgi:hypothetical protein